MPASLHCIVTGRVQGVWFRGWVREMARDLKIKGWVRNKRDGAVELVAQGDEERLRKLRAMLEAGPPMSRVDSVREQWVELDEEFSRFEVRY